MSLTRTRLLDRFDVDFEAGVFTYKHSAGSIKAGSRAGSVYANGYRYIRIERKGYLEHRLMWLAAYGVWPEHEIDHLNGDRADNRLVNLEDVTCRENLHRVIPLGETGHRGVSYSRNGQRFRARIESNGVKVSLGTFDTAELASAAYQEALRDI